MESVHGVDVSWLHRPSPSKTNTRRPRAVSTTLVSIPSDEPHSHSDKSPLNSNASKLHISEAHGPASPKSIPTSVPAVHSSDGNGLPKRPGLLSRYSADRLSPADVKSVRRGSWMTTISSKFASQQSPTSTSPASSVPSSPNPNDVSPSSSPKPGIEAFRGETEEELTPYVPQKPRETSTSFFSSLTRRLAPNSPSESSNRTKLANGGLCERVILNLDLNRQRCPMLELKEKSLRRVAFSVDVEIACAPRHFTAERLSVEQDNGDSKADVKKKVERAEGEALKNPDAAAKAVIASDENKSRDEAILEDASSRVAPSTGSSKKEKKKKSEEERKERNEQKRRKAEESGALPLELTFDETDDGLRATRRPRSTSTKAPANDRPTTDPVRIYRRCCQLRESPILKRITEQLMSPACVIPGSNGTVALLNLTGSRMQLADVISLADWLAIVPVKRLVLEDSDLTDEGVRIVLAGLLAAQSPQPSKHSHKADDHEGWMHPCRFGYVEKLSLKNNPRVTAFGWSHISLFLYMCRSIKAIDLSLIPFPQSALQSHGDGPVSPSTSPSPSHFCKAEPVEIFAKALSERPAGSTLEEIILSECALDARQVRRIVDAAVICGVSRLGMAGANLDDSAFESILSYIRSNVCTALDIGSNTLIGRATDLAEALTHSSNSRLWGLSLASCHLDSPSFETLLVALEQLPDFRFLDISHNKGLCDDIDSPGSGIQLLRRYIPRLRHLKRLHLVDVGMSTQQAIALAEILPEGPALAHLSLLENAELAASISKTDEGSQEEACALFASLMAAVKVSTSIVCIDIDVPPAQSSEVVKALAKQVVAYCLRNMGNLPFSSDQETAASALSEPHQKNVAQTTNVPDVLQHLVGQDDDDDRSEERCRDGETAPDEDYIVGGTGVVKALQYCLGEKAKDTPRDTADHTNILEPVAMMKKGKAKEMSKGLLESARKIRARLQPALVTEEVAGDEMSYRRLLLLDGTLQGMIQRFEDEYPETRLGTGSIVADTNNAASVPVEAELGSHSLGPQTKDCEVMTEPVPHDDAEVRRARQADTDVSLAARAQTQEEGLMHRHGQNIRRDIFNAETDEAPNPATEKSGPDLDRLAKRIENMSGDETKELVARSGWHGVMQHLGANVEDIRRIHEADPEAWKRFEESQVKARLNLDV